MIFIKKFFFILLICLFNFSIAFSSEKVVFIDIDFLLNNSNLGKVIFKELDKVNKDNIKLLETKEKKKIYNAKMINIIGEEIVSYRSKNYSDNEFFFDYGKKEIKANRKMGHLTVIQR